MADIASILAIQQRQPITPTLTLSNRFGRFMPLVKQWTRSQVPYMYGKITGADPFQSNASVALLEAQALEREEEVMQQLKRERRLRAMKKEATDNAQIATPSDSMPSISRYRSLLETFTAHASTNDSSSVNCSKYFQWNERSWANGFLFIHPLVKTTDEVEQVLKQAKAADIDYKACIFETK